MRLFKRHDSTALAEPLCVHGVLVARWDQLADMGNEDLASHFACEACGESFTPVEARGITSRNAAFFARTI